MQAEVVGKDHDEPTNMDAVDGQSLAVVCHSAVTIAVHVRANELPMAFRPVIA